jgi:ATP-binding cassette subfamily B protein
VRFEGVRFAYDVRRQILRDVDFTIAPGETVAVVGHSGSGKSTLARLLYRFYDVDAGRITITDAQGIERDIRDYTQHSVRATIAIVPQDTVLFNDTIYYNIEYGRPGATRDEVEHAARAATIPDLNPRARGGHVREDATRDRSQRPAHPTAPPSRDWSRWPR